MTGRTAPLRGPSLPGALPLALAALFALAVLSRVCCNDLIWDDEMLIKHTASLGAPGTAGDWVAKPFWHNAEIAEKTARDYWRPLTSLLLWLTAFFFGKWPPAFHGLSVLVALGAAATLYLLARMTYPGGSRLPAAGIALLFLAHPLAAEVICMAANISDHLAFAFLGLATVLLMRRLEGGATGWAALVASLLVFMACASKELGLLGAAAPLAAWLLLRARGAAVPARRLREPWPWLGCAGAAAAYVVLRHVVLSAAGEESAGIPGYGFYAKAVFFGLGQAAKHILAPVPSGAHVYLDAKSALPVLLSALVLLGLAAAVVGIYRKKALGLPGCGLLLALALLLPSLLAVDPHGDALRFPVRYFHLPLAGVLLAALPYIHASWNRKTRLALPAAAVLLSLLSFVRIAEWRDNVAFFGAEARYHPDSLLDQHNLARALVYARAYDRAAEVIERMEGMPGADDPEFRNSLVNEKATIALLRDEDVEGATELLRRALIEKPDNLANTLDLAAMRVFAGRPDQAVTILRKALDAPWFRDHRRRAIEGRLRMYEDLVAKEQMNNGQ